MATSTSAAKAHARLDTSGLSKFMRAVAAGDEVSRGKPEPDLYLLAARRLEVDPVDCLVFEDSPAGSLGAHRAGMKVIVIPDVKPPPPELREFALGIFPSLPAAQSTLEDWLDN